MINDDDNDSCDEDDGDEKCQCMIMIMVDVGLSLNSKNESEEMFGISLFDFLSYVIVRMSNCFDKEQLHRPPFYFCRPENHCCDHVVPCCW